LDGHIGLYKRHGIGTTAVRFFLSCTDDALELLEDDGIMKSDGSHLVEDGTAFIQHLQDKLGDRKLSRSQARQ
jgi:hypothetical protein